MNIAFIDGQNLNLGTMEDGWKVSHQKLRVYLKDKYNVGIAFYFIGYYSNKYTDLYSNLVRSEYSLVYREHSDEINKIKKGNVDVDIVFEIMRQIIENLEFEKAVIVSGDGDFIKTVKYLISKNKLEKILFPSFKYYSSLYNKIDGVYFDFLLNVRKQIEYLPDINEKGP